MMGTATGANETVTPLTEHLLHARYHARHFTTSFHIYIVCVCVYTVDPWEQRAFELRGSTYTRCFSVASATAPHGPQLLESTDAEPQLEARGTGGRP